MQYFSFCVWVLRCDWSLGRDVCQGAEKVRAVDNLPGRAVEARGSEQEYGLSGTGRDDRLVGQMGLEGKAAGAIGLHQDVVRQFRKAADGDEGVCCAASSSLLHPSVWIKISCLVMVRISSMNRMRSSAVAETSLRYMTEFSR